MVKYTSVKQLSSENFEPHIEGKFGEGKRKYDLDLVKTKTMATSESWIAAVFFVMNIAHWWRLCFFVSFSDFSFSDFSFPKFYLFSKNLFIISPDMG